jgi:hypothetical protein
MNVPAVQTRLVVVGTTGMVAGYAMGYGLDHPPVTAIGRRRLGISHPKLKRFGNRTLRTAPHSRTRSRVSTRQTCCRADGRRRQWMDRPVLLLPRCWGPRLAD